MTDEEFRDQAILAALPGIIQAHATLYASSLGSAIWVQIFPSTVVEDTFALVDRLVERRLAERQQGT